MVAGRARPRHRDRDRDDHYRLAHAERSEKDGPPSSRGSGLSVVTVTVARSLLLFALAATAEIGRAWLVWQGIREHRGLLWIGAGFFALAAYGLVATLQPDADFGRIVAAYGGVFVAGSLIRGMAADGSKPDRYDVVGAASALWALP